MGSAGVWACVCVSTERAGRLLCDEFGSLDDCFLLKATGAESEVMAICCTVRG